MIKANPLFCFSIGIGTLIYQLMDMRSTLSRRISRKVRAQLIAMEWTANHVERTGRATRRALRLSIWDLQNRFYRQLEETKKKREGMEKEKQEAEKGVRYWTGMKERTEGLEKEVDEINVSDKQVLESW